MITPHTNAITFAIRTQPRSGFSWTLVRDYVFVTPPLPPPLSHSRTDKTENCARHGDAAIRAARKPRTKLKSAPLKHNPSKTAVHVERVPWDYTERGKHHHLSTTRQNRFFGTSMGSSRSTAWCVSQATIVRVEHLTCTE